MMSVFATLQKSHIYGLFRYPWENFRFLSSIDYIIPHIHTVCQVFFRHLFCKLVFFVLPELSERCPKAVHRRVLTLILCHKDLHILLLSVTVTLSVLWTKRFPTSTIGNLSHFIYCTLTLSPDVLLEKIKGTKGNSLSSLPMPLLNAITVLRSNFLSFNSGASNFFILSLPFF